MLEKTVQILFPATPQTSPPPPFKGRGVSVSSEMVRAYSIVDLAVRRLLLVGVLLDQACFQLEANI